MKKLMILGGSRYAIPVIRSAHQNGIYVITADYLPENDAHKYSDEFVNVSVIEKDKVLSVAQQKQIDGIISFACDPGVVSAAYVAEKMHLPFQCSYGAACTLQDKGLFREFLAKNAFHCPTAKRYEDKEEALRDSDSFDWPVMVKPTDSAGSKGVTRVDSFDGLSEAIDIALDGAHNGAFIIEEYLFFEGYHSSADLFTVDGELQFCTFSDQLFDPEADNPYTPARIIWPSTMKDNYQEELTHELQRLVSLLDMKTGIYNVETCVANGKPYIMEVSPRGGGCKIAELQKMAYGVDLIEAEIKKAVGLPVKAIPQTICDGYWCEAVVHAGRGQEGVLDSIAVDDAVREKYLKLTDLSAKKGDHVRPFTGANMALGDMFFRFSSREELDRVMSKQNEWLHINLESGLAWEGDPAIVEEIPNSFYKIVRDRKLMDFVIKDCDSAFPSPPSDWPDYDELFDKWSRLADMIVVFGSKTMGYAVIYANDHKTQMAYITLIGVKPEFQKQGCGRFLIEACEDLSRERGMQQLSLEVSKENTSGISFYRHLGFSPCEERAQSWIYVKDL